jgi:hypothetical protein
MNVIIGCEFSGTVRDAFAAKGHDAWSCDLLPSETNGNHIQGDILEVINSGYWDLGIFHPPCTYLTVSANKWLKDQPERKSGALTGEARRRAVEDSVNFFMEFVNCKIPRWCIENPIGIMSTRYRKPNQVIQPWMYGHGETKATCLWLRKLPRLNGFNVVEGRDQRLHKLSPGPDRWKERSKTFSGIASAMAEQWG